MNRYKVAIVCICLNEPYWQYVQPMIESARKFLLKGHEVDFILWSDMPKTYKVDAKIIPTEPFTWPLPTLYRYHLFLREEELLSEYDYVFYVDCDMKFVSRVGDEILGDLVAAQHPMYAISKSFIPPYEDNPKSTSYIPRLGRMLADKKFQPLYLAGGFQGGRADIFIDAMKKMKLMIDEDFTKNNYIPKWNDESAWNKFLFERDPLMSDVVVLNPSYIYPDSLNKSYYQKVWGRNYVPKLVTLTKKFSLTKQAAGDIQQTLKTL